MVSSEIEHCIMQAELRFLPSVEAVLSWIGLAKLIWSGDKYFDRCFKSFPQWTTACCMAHRAAAARLETPILVYTCWM